MVVALGFGQSAMGQSVYGRDNITRMVNAFTHAIFHTHVDEGASHTVYCGHCAFSDTVILANTQNTDRS